MTTDKIIAEQQAILQECKKEFVSALHHDSLNDYIVEKLIKRIDTVSQEIETLKVGVLA